MEFIKLLLFLTLNETFIIVVMGLVREQRAKDDGYTKERALLFP